MGPGCYWPAIVEQLSVAAVADQMAGGIEAIEDGITTLCANSKNALWTEMLGLFGGLFWDFKKW